MEEPANGDVRLATTVLVAVASAQVREALVAILGTLDGFHVVAEADTGEAAVEAARSHRPSLALVEPELSGYGGWWAIQQIQSERLASVVVALGQRADGVLARLCGAQSYVQMGTAPRELLRALEAAMLRQTERISVGQAERDVLTDTHTML